MIGINPNWQGTNKTPHQDIAYTQKLKFSFLGDSHRFQPSL